MTKLDDLQDLLENEETPGDKYQVVCYTKEGERRWETFWYSTEAKAWRHAFDISAEWFGDDDKLELERR